MGRVSDRGRRARGSCGCGGHAGADSLVNSRLEVGTDAHAPDVGIVGQRAETRIGVGDNVGALKGVAELHQVTAHHAGATCLEKSPDCCRPGERVERAHGLDPFAIQQIADEGQEFGLVANVAQNGRVAGRALSARESGRTESRK